MTTNSSIDKSSNSTAQQVRTVYTVDCVVSSLRLGSAAVSPLEDFRAALFLPLHAPDPISAASSKLQAAIANPVHELEKKLIFLSERGKLRSAEFLIGSTTDPFHPYKDRFNLTLKLLKLFERFTPARVIIQTRSPLVVLGLPTLKKLGEHVSVALVLETCSEESVAQYTPEFPKVRERLNAAAALRHLGVAVDLHVAPLLPYGDLVEDAGFFARQLVKNSRSILVLPFNFCDQVPGRASHHLVVESLQRDGKAEWLRADAAQPLMAELKRLAPEKLGSTGGKQLVAKQTELFAA